MLMAHALLVEAAQKLIDLSASPEWAVQLPARCPPVLWFGDAISGKRRVLTVGANPSRKEFLTDSTVQALKKAPRSSDQSPLAYREAPANRFRVLSSKEKFADILTSHSLQGEIIESYNRYFSGTHHYAQWFGKESEQSYNVEGFLRGFGASYYETTLASLQAVHIDLFPFTTLDDFVAISKIVESALFADGWAKRLVRRLVEMLSPLVLIIFGITNCRHFAQHIDESLNLGRWEAFNSGKYFIGHAMSLGLPIVGLSTNLGNPKGFSALGLRAFGVHVRRALQLRD